MNSRHIARSKPARNCESKVETHDYALYLAPNDVEHTNAKTQSPQTTGIFERLHKTVLQEFHQDAFHEKHYGTPEELQTELDEWLRHYNTERTHQSKIRSGRTPIATLED